LVDVLLTKTVVIFNGLRLKISIRLIALSHDFTQRNRKADEFHYVFSSFCESVIAFPNELTIITHFKAPKKFKTEAEKVFLIGPKRSFGYQMGSHLAILDARPGAGANLNPRDGAIWAISRHLRIGISLTLPFSSTTVLRPLFDLWFRLRRTWYANPTTFSDFFVSRATCLISSALVVKPLVPWENRVPYRVPTL
jgi:hypothetical protein